MSELFEREPYYGASLEKVLNGHKKPKSAAWHNQHNATPERQQRRKEVAYVGIRQYKKLNRMLHNHAQKLGYTYKSYPVEGSDPALSELNKRQMIQDSAVKDSLFKGDPLVMNSEGTLTVSDSIGVVI